jgi:hypothetical protein
MMKKESKATEKEGVDSRPWSDDTVFLTLKCVLFVGMKPDIVQNFF